MRILADECVFRQIVECLREDGHDVQWVKESFPGLDDEEVLSKANEDQRILLTEDKDFGELTVRFRFEAIGIVTVSMSDLAGRLDEIASYVAQVFIEFGDSFEGNLTIIKPGRIRQRSLLT